MKTNIPGLIVTLIITFNLICVAAFFILRVLRRRQEPEDGEE